jgi:hypothetical protein
MNITLVASASVRAAWLFALAFAHTNRHRPYACEITAQALDAGSAVERTAMLVL